MSEFAFPSNYGLPLLSATLLAFECLITGFAVAGRARSKVFTPEFLKSNFAEEHFESTRKEDVSQQGGYPDMGSGRYSKKLTYGDWLYFNRAQRVHYNFLEQIAPLLLFIVVSGIEFPVWSATFGGVLFISRILYCFYVCRGGPKNPLRMVGALLGDIAILVLFVLTIITCAKHVK